MTDPIRLFLAATPIGNIADASPRLCELLETVDVIACEDTRKARALVAALGLNVKGRFLSNFDQNEAARVPEILEMLKDGQSVLVISDAGMPSVSDPGYRIASAASAAGYKFTVIPGPSAVTTALALSGLASDRWSFEGFLSRKTGERQKQLADLASEKRTMIFFEAPHRITETIADMISVFGADRPAALCRELTKTYEEVTRGTLADLARRCEAEILGEITVVVEGRRIEAEASDAQLIEAVQSLLDSGMERKAAIGEVMERYGVQKRRIFDLLVKSKAPKS